MAQDHLSYAIRRDDLTDPAVIDLLAFHLAEMHRWSPPETVHAMPVERLRKPDIAFYSAWANGALAAVGALKSLNSLEGEIKSMRAAPTFRGKGAGEAILLHLIAEAGARGYRLLRLETGRPAPFQPAADLYRRHGFRECPPFGDYANDEWSFCMARQL